MRAAVRAIAAATVLAIALAACGGQGQVRGRHRPAVLRIRARAAGTPLTSDAPTQLRGLRVGRQQRLRSGGAVLEVDVRGLLDPLLGSGAVLPRGTRAVAAFVQIRNSGPGTYDSSATGDFGLVVTRGLVTPLMIPRGRCRTPLNDFDRDITAGEDRVGCVAFAVSTGARLLSITFSAHADPRMRLSWRG